MNKPRVIPVPPEDLDSAQRAYLAPFTDARGRYPNIFGVLCRNMPLLDAWTSFGLYTMRASRLDPLLREVLILRTSVNARCDYEWHHHRRIALALGMTESEIDAVRDGDASADSDHGLMIRCADDLAHGSKLSDAVWTTMVERFGIDYTIDTVFTVGSYTALAMGLNSCGVAIEGRAPPGSAA